MSVARKSSPGAKPSAGPRRIGIAALAAVAAAPPPAASISGTGAGNEGVASAYRTVTLDPIEALCQQ